MPAQIEAATVKTCCAAVYQSDFARLLLGDSFHPGGLRLTARLGELLGLRPGARVLDVASGKGESAIFLAQRFGCEVVGIDFGAGNIAEATERVGQAGVAGSVSFREGDAERLDFPKAGFDAVVCECAFCTFPDKASAAREFARVLKPGGKVGLSDLTRAGALPRELEGLLAWVACIADARPVQEYSAYLEAAGIQGIAVEAHDGALSEMIREVQGKLMGAELIAKLKGFDLAGVDLKQAKSLARAAAEAIRSKQLGYAILTGSRS